MSTTTCEIYGADILRRSVQIFTCSLLAGSCTFAHSGDDLTAELRAEYPDYSVRSEMYAGGCGDASEDAGHSCIVTGDFNSDGYKDVSAVLRRAISW